MAALLLLLGFPASGIHAQSVSAPWAVPAEPTLARVPFGPGERLEYQVKWGWFGVGDASLTVHGVDTIRGNPTYHVSMDVKGGIPLARIDDTFESWIDTRRLVSHRFIQDQNETHTKRLRHFEFFPSEARFEREDNGEEGTIPTDAPLDDISFIYFIRTLPLEVGDEYRFDRYFKESGNPVVIKVLRKDRMTTSAGEFNTIVVQPIIQTKGLFSQGGHAEIHFSDDARRLVVYLKTGLPIGTMHLYLRSYDEGQSLRPLLPPRPRDSIVEGPATSVASDSVGGH